MIYLRPHVQALEQQIAYLKERLEKAERDIREAAEAARAREDALLDRLLVKNNVAPVTESLVSAPMPEILTPYNALGSEAQEAYKESWMREETDYIMRELQIDEGSARAYAEQEYVAKHQVIK